MTVAPNMQALKPLPALTALSFLPLLVSSGPQGKPTKPNVWVDPPNPVILSSSSIVMNCSTDCTDSAVIGLETSSPNKIEESKGTNWKTFRLMNVTQDNSPLCFVNCEGKSQGLTRANITVYEPPKNLQLNLEPFQDQSSLPWIPVHKNIILSCHVAGGRPRQNLKVVLLRGAQEISRESVQENILDKAIVKFSIQATREDDEASFSCLAELDLRPRGLELFQKSSGPLKFYTFALPSKGPVLVTPRFVEAGTKMQVSCEMDKLFPVEKAHMLLSWGGQRLAQDNITRHGDMLKATATIIVAEEEAKGERELTCNVTLGNETKEASEEVTLYTFPKPHLNVNKYIQEGDRVNVTCEAQPPAKVMMEEAPPDEPDRISLIVQEKDNGRLFNCQATLELKEETLHKNNSLKLNVLFPPKLDEGCPENWKWQEGTEQTLKCTARGNPAPTVRCIPEKQQTGMPPNILHRVIRAYNGTYSCTAKNSLGEVNKVVSVVVEFNEVNLRPLIISISIIVLLVGILTTVGYIYYRQQRIRSYELKKAQEAKSLQLLSPKANPCP